MFHALMSADLDDGLLRHIVGGILKAGTESVPQHAFRYRDKLVVPIVEWLNAAGHEAEIWRAGRPWTQFLRVSTDSVVAWLMEHQPNSSLLPFLATALPADAASLTSLSLLTWRPMISGMSALSHSDRLPASAFLLALGLRHCDAVAQEFIQASFEAVHEAAERSTLDYEYWRPIEMVAPALGWWREWDKCERMRAALVDRFMACDWPPHKLFNVITRADTLELVFGLSTSTKTRKKFLKHVAKIGIDTVDAPECRAVLKRYM